MGQRTGRKPVRRKSPESRAGTPSPDTVREAVNKVAPTGFRFRILKTTETDSYDKPHRVSKVRRTRPK